MPPSIWIARSQSCATAEQLVGDEEHGAPGAAELLHATEAAALELRVPDGEHLVDEQDLGLEVRGDGEREPHVHAARVALDRRVDEPLDARRTRRSRRSAASISRRFIPRIAPFR